MEIIELLTIMDGFSRVIIKDTDDVVDDFECKTLYEGEASCAPFYLCRKKIDEVQVASAVVQIDGVNDKFSTEPALIIYCYYQE